MLHCALNSAPTPARPRVCAVSFLNTVPLVWGMQHGPQKDLFDLSFSVPSECADKVISGEAEIGIIPVVEILRHDFPYFADVGIVCRGAVRSILLISKTPPAQIRSLALDWSSRTSVMLARIVLARKYGCFPQLVSHPPDLPSMLSVADAALIIGDPALKLQPADLPYEIRDLGAEWLDLTGLPMVFALWSGPNLPPDLRDAFVESLRYGIKHLDDIVSANVSERGLPAPVIREYLTRYIGFELQEDHLRGLETFFRYLKEFES